MLKSVRPNSIRKGVVQVAIVSAVASDLTGVRGEEAEFGKLTVRRHPAINGTAKVRDVKPDEIEDLEQVGDVVFLEYEPPGGGDVKELVVKREDFDALAKTGDMATILTNARGAPRPSPLCLVPVRLPGSCYPRTSLKHLIISCPRSPLWEVGSGPHGNHYRRPGWLARRPSV